LECCHSARIPSPGALFLFDFRNLRHMWNYMNNYFRLIIGICVFREKNCMLFSVLRILPEWRWFVRRCSGVVL